MKRGEFATDWDIPRSNAKERQMLGEFEGSPRAAKQKSQR